MDFIQDGVVEFSHTSTSGVSVGIAMALALIGNTSDDPDTKEIRKEISAFLEVLEIRFPDLKT